MVTKRDIVWMFIIGVILYFLQPAKIDTILIVSLILIVTTILMFILMILILKISEKIVKVKPITKRKLFNTTIITEVPVDNKQLIALFSGLWDKINEIIILKNNNRSPTSIVPFGKIYLKQYELDMLTKNPELMVAYRNSISKYLNKMYGTPKIFIKLVLKEIMAIIIPTIIVILIKFYI